MSPGPWFLAAFSSDCSWGDEIEEGDETRADGEGGYEHLDCWLDTIPEPEEDLSWMDAEEPEEDLS